MTDPEAIRADLLRVRQEPLPVDYSSAGCALAIVAIITIVLMPFIGRGFDLPGPVMGAIGGVLLLAALAGGLYGIFGGGRTEAAARVEVSQAVETLTSDWADATARREAAVRLLDRAHVQVGPTTSSTFDTDEIADRLGDRLPYVEEIERILLEGDLIYPVFTARSLPG